MAKGKAKDMGGSAGKSGGSMDKKTMRNVSGHADTAKGGMKGGKKKKR